MKHKRKMILFLECWLKQRRGVFNQWYEEWIFASKSIEHLKCFGFACRCRKVKDYESGISIKWIFSLVKKSIIIIAIEHNSPFTNTGWGVGEARGVGEGVGGGVGETGWGISVLLELVLLLFLFLILREVAFVFDCLIVGDFSLRNRSPLAAS